MSADVVELHLIPPGVEDAERGILSAVLMDHSLRGVGDDLRPEDFATASLGVMYAAAADLHKRGQRIDPLTLRRELERRGDLSAAGGVDHIGDLVDAIPTSENLPEYVRITIDAAKNRAATKHFGDLARLASQGRLLPMELADRAEKAASALRGMQGATRFTFLTDAEIEEMPPLEYLVDGAIPAGSLAALVAPPGSGKSFCALALCVSVATGTEWLGYAIARPGPAIMIAAEGSSGIKQRLEASKAALGLTGQAIDVRFLIEPVNFFESAESRSFELALRTLPAAPALIVIDTLHRSMEGADENSARDMGRVIAGVDRIRKATGATVLLVHHTNHTGEKERGSTSLRGAVDTLLQLRPDDDQLQLTCEKQKDAAPFPPIGIELVPTAGSCVIRRVRLGGVSLTASLTPNQLGILRSLNGLSRDGKGVTKTLAKDDSKLQKGTFYRLVNQLEKQGYLTQKDRGNSTIITLTASGFAALGITESHAVSPESHPSLGLKSHESHPPLGVNSVRPGETRPDIGRKA